MAVFTGGFGTAGLPTATPRVRNPVREPASQGVSDAFSSVATLNFGILKNIFLFSLYFYLVKN